MSDRPPSVATHVDTPHGSMRIEEYFVRMRAGTHFVALSYRLRRGAVQHYDHISCFVIELRGVWLLVTAGHWLDDPDKGLRRLVSDGWAVDNKQLIDNFANGRCDSPLPFSFALEDWSSIYDDDNGVDFAAMKIEGLYRMGLEKAGVHPIEQNAIADAGFHADSQVVMVGVPAESFQRTGSDAVLKLMCVPLTEYTGDALPQRGNTYLAAMSRNPDEPEHRVEDIRGMSGCPIFRVVTAANIPKKYWLIGIQSGWYERLRVVRFCPLQAFVDALDAGVQAQGATGQSQ
jgi:hypothetical protein